MKHFREERHKDYILPEKIILATDNVTNAENLLSDSDLIKQDVFDYNKYCEINGKGYIVFDFGKEYFGGIRIMTHAHGYKGSKPYLRIRFGESLEECCSEIGEKNCGVDHSTRDILCFMPHHSDMQWGSTGYRFVRLDFTEEGLFRINKVYGVYVHTDDAEGYFKSDDELLNSVYETAAHTLHLNMQNYIWDGAKRDQHVWFGDLYPELLGILYLYGDCREIRNTLDIFVNRRRKDFWVHSIPSYSFWFILCVKEYFNKTGNIESRYLENVRQLLQAIDKCVDKDGCLDFTKSGYKTDNNYARQFFFDWPSWGTEDSREACRLLSVYTMREVVSCGYFDEDIRALAKNIGKRFDKSKFSFTAFKAINAFGVLTDKNDKGKAVQDIVKGGAHGYSSFMSYFISKALAENGKLKVAYDNNMEYYGGMLKMGATTFWEGFDVEWMKNSCRIDELPKKGQKSIHGDFGKFCYEGLRMSLCHGWSCGVLSFIIEQIAGVNFKDGDCRTVYVKPNLLDLKSIDCAIPTCSGLLTLKITGNGGKVLIDYSAPEGITVITV